MASYVKLLRSIWQDPDFLALPASPQRAYMLLMSQPDISHCGVLPLTPGRWGHLAVDTDADSVRRDIHTLMQPPRTTAPFVLVDAGTEELLVRSYTKHDEGYRVPNGRIALARAIERVMSVPLRQAVLTLVESLAVTLPPTLGSPQQPAAMNHEPLPAAAASSRDRSGNGHSTLSRRWQDLPAAAAAALSALLDYKLVAADPQKPSGYRASLRRGLPNDHGDDLMAYLAGHPDATPLLLCTEVLGMRKRDAQPHLEAQS